MTYTIEKTADRALIMTRATDFVVVTFWSPKSGSGAGHYDYETFADLSEAQEAFETYEDGEYRRARAVCIFASRHGVPIGRIL